MEIRQRLVWLRSRPSKCGGGWGARRRANPHGIRLAGEAARRRAGFVTLPLRAFLAAWSVAALLAGHSGVGQSAIEVFLLAGASNASGQANAAALSPRPDSRGQLYPVHGEVCPGVLFAHREMDWRPRAVVFEQGLGPLATHDFGVMGAEMSLGRDLRAGLRKPVALVKFTSRGSDMRAWTRNADILFPLLLECLRQQKTALRALGFSEVHFRGLFWLHGECDCDPDRSAVYATYAAGFFRELREALASPGLIVVMAPLKENLVDRGRVLYTYLNRFSPTINSRMRALTVTDPLFRVAGSTDDLGTDDGVHYDADSVVEVGHRLGAGWFEAALPSLNRPACVPDQRNFAQFQFRLDLEPGTAYRIEASTDLSRWTLVESGVALGAALDKSYPRPTNHTRLFYRAVAN